MDVTKIVYFLDCYYLMVDYDEPLEKIVSDYIQNETESYTQELINECIQFLNLSKEEKEKVRALIIEHAAEFDVCMETLEQILSEIFATTKLITK